FSSRRRHTRSKRDWSSDVCSSDLKDLNINIPNQLSIIGSDNTPVTNLVSPRLSTTNVDLKNIGETAISRLFLKLNTKNTYRNINCIFPMDYIERETTASLK